MKMLTRAVMLMVPKSVTESPKAGVGAVACNMSRVPSFLEGSE